MTFRLAAAAISLVPPLCAVAQGSSKQIPARTEIHSIPSLTISDEQFLRGDSAGKPVVVSGVLRIAQGAGRLPAVVLIHGSGGMGPNIDFWSRELNAMGINAATGQPFTYKDACVERNPHVGCDLAAAAGARQEVGAFLTTLFKLY